MPEVNFKMKTVIDFELFDNYGPIFTGQLEVMTGYTPEMRADLIERYLDASGFSRADIKKLRPTLEKQLKDHVTALNEALK